MNVIPNIYPNCTLVNLGTHVDLFYSYRELVAASVDGEYYVTDKRFSRTTSGHIERFVGDRAKIKVSHDHLKALGNIAESRVEAWKKEATNAV